ncbi:hypothetical protein BO86DRAFT_179150 [Aspergillus japonicus CBS 114.51]|uniref:Uncharacterized protein n=1 Tax=Aspergillus japonicus CBS 114.51 TaxID=1448312 RepID=A0A8T8WSG1_ASPJA|nr:hypothetical protein BO86DRAFT_179150 [Aspergillus japonicus CBS 114.51]RAH78610.1 hypothetical protein BO86DRAFT_179150 [Aspergillus japonicus CBS 114.51]
MKQIDLQYLTQQANYRVDREVCHPAGSAALACRDSYRGDCVAIPFWAVGLPVDTLRTVRPELLPSCLVPRANPNARLLAA